MATLAVRQAEDESHPVPKGFDGFVEENGEKFFPLMKEPAKRFRKGENKLVIRG